MRAKNFLKNFFKFLQVYAARSINVIKKGLELLFFPIQTSRQFNNMYRRFNRSLHQPAPESFGVVFVFSLEI